MEVLQFYLCGNLSSDTVQMFETAYKEKFANYGLRIAVSRDPEPVAE